jgi:hypothetical protein
MDNKLFIKQELEYAEIFTGFETKNKYSILDENKNKLFYAYETENNFLINQILGIRRPLSIKIIDISKKEILKIQRPFYFFNSSAKITSEERLIGTIKQKNWFLDKQFDFYDNNNNLLFSCISKFPHIWTFNVLKEGKQIGQILKKWAGLGREAFTDADKFMIDFDNIEEEKIQYAMLAMAFVIDLRVFEAKGKHP